MIHADNLHKKFRRKRVLNGLDLDLDEGGIHGLLGRNGVGKSTLLSILAGQLSISDGEITVFGESPFDNARVMDRVALTGVDVTYPSSWKAKDVFTAASMRYPRWDDGFREELIADFELGDALDTKYGKLSRGQRAMVAIIVGLASGAELTLLDEPYVGLDVHNTEVFYRHLLALSGSERTFILATHHIDDAARVLDSAIILSREGHVAATVHPEDADNYVVATGDFDEPEGALAYQRLGATAKALLHTDSPALQSAGPRTSAVDFGDLIENFLEAS